MSLFLVFHIQSLGGNIMSAYPNSDLNPVLAAGNCRVSVISKGLFRSSVKRCGNDTSSDLFW